jgi:protein-S-isoprenylcysteine O-methyltransferase Ste14
LAEVNKTPFVLSIGLAGVAFLVLAATYETSALLKLPIIMNPILVFFGVVLVIGGFTIRYLAFKRILKVNTDFHSKHVPEHCITDGVFRYSRNPAYTGILLMFMGALFFAINVLMVAVLLFEFARFNQMASREERVLTEKFGDEYLSYKRRTPKWL